TERFVPFPTIAVPAGRASPRSTVIALDQLDVVYGAGGHGSALFCPRHFGGSKMLRNEVFHRIRLAEFVRAAIDAGIMPAEIIERRRRVRIPFEGRGVPGILPGLGAVLQTPEKIEQKENLRARRDERGPGDEIVDGLQGLQEIHRRVVRVAPDSARDSQPVHWHEDEIRADKREPEMDL